MTDYFPKESVALDRIKDAYNNYKYNPKALLIKRDYLFALLCSLQGFTKFDELSKIFDQIKGDDNPIVDVMKHFEKFIEKINNQIASETLDIGMFNQTDYDRQDIWFNEYQKTQFTNYFVKGDWY